MLQGNGNPLVAIGLKRPSELSQRGALFVAQFEGFVATPYNDPANNATIGFGHLLHYGPVNENDRRNYPRPLTRSQSLALLRHDAQIASAAVRRYITVYLNQNQFDALCDFAYNCGAGSLHATRVADAVNRQDYAALPGALGAWVHGSNGVALPGLVQRRQAESHLFLTGNYGV